MRESKCAIIGGVCPRSNDPAYPGKNGTYCNHWVVGIPETNTDSSGKFMTQTYTGCFLVRLPNYMISIAAGAGHAAASYDKAHNVLQQADISQKVKALLTYGIAGFVGNLAQQVSHNNQPKEIEQCVTEKQS